MMENIKPSTGIEGDEVTLTLQFKDGTVKVTMPPKSARGLAAELVHHAEFLEKKAKSG